jgi:membrane associated rhomboid family serine protease
LLEFLCGILTSVLMMRKITILAAICAAMIAVHIFDLFLGGALKSFGIQPREMGTAYTIATAPWLHGSFAHLGSNLSALVVLGALCLLNGVRYFVKASGLIIVLTGACVWLFGRDASNHIGASGWVFGLWSLAIASAWFDRSYPNILIAVAVVFFYGGMIFGVLPTQSHISFESHFFGAIAGVAAASILSRPKEQIAASPSAPPQLKFWS